MHVCKVLPYVMYAYNITIITITHGRWYNIGGRCDIYFYLWGGALAEHAVMMMPLDSISYYPGPYVCSCSSTYLTPMIDVQINLKKNINTFPLLFLALG